MHNCQRLFDDTSANSKWFVAVRTFKIHFLLTLMKEFANNFPLGNQFYHTKIIVIAASPQHKESRCAQLFVPQSMLLQID